MSRKGHFPISAKSKFLKKPRECLSVCLTSFETLGYSRYQKEEHQTGRQEGEVLEWSRRGYRRGLLRYLQALESLELGGPGSDGSRVQAG